MKRIMEGVAIAVLSSAITWAAGHGTVAREGTTHVWNGMSRGLGRYEGIAWWMAGVALFLALVALGVRTTRSWEPGFWEVDLHLPSPALVLVSAAFIAALAAVGLRLAGQPWDCA